MKILRLLGLLLGGSAAAHAQAQDPPIYQMRGHYERVIVHGASLVGNLAGDAPDRQVSVYLPPDYATNKRARYPVLYLLHGFTDSDARWFGQRGPHFVHAPRAVDAAFASGVRSMIIVMPDAFTKFQGSMYSSSMLTGDWGTFVTRDLVGYIDARYRTLAKPASRGLAGHSMGGYGTLRLAMKHPGVFSSLYAMSSCCLEVGAPPPLHFLESAARVQTDADIAAADFPTKAMLASAAAWSPNPRKPPLYIDLPIRDGRPDPAVHALWTANSPLAMVHQYIPVMKSYRALFIDSGDKDAVAVTGSRQLHDVLEGYGVVHGFETYDGDHLNRIEERLTTEVLPFFGSWLEAAKRK